MQTDFLIVSNEEIFTKSEGIKINYSHSEFKFKTFNIHPHPIIFEKNISIQTIDCFETNGTIAFFKTTQCDFNFDIFAASFYLISRYEEYLPYQKDMYGRYAHENSIAYKNNFLHLPLINIWAKKFRCMMSDLRSEMLDTSHLKSHISNQTSNIQHPTSFIPTYDIDIAYSYKQKGFLRNVGGFLKSPSTERIKVLLGLQKDPFDSYHWMDELHLQFHLQPIYFFLLADKNGPYDKNILPTKKILRKLVLDHSKKYKTGIHPSWQSGDDFNLLNSEIKCFKNLIHIPDHQPICSRQHYIRFTIPAGYRRLIDAGIQEDYSMGYGSINGFRASVANPFYWYDLEKEEQTSLKIYPFCFMEANSFYEQKFKPKQAYEELTHYYNICKQNNGIMISIFHNHFLGTDKSFAGWKEMYQNFLAFISQDLINS